MRERKREGDTERDKKSKESSRERQRRRRKEAAAMVWIYNWDQRRGEPWWAVAGTGVNGCMQEHEESKFESAGELEVFREMRGKAER